jgi:predicted ArsR family transcriptional regulator
MTIAPTSGLGWTLARLAALTPLLSPRPDDETRQSREHILQLVRASQEPLSVEELCAATGLHANTVRGHLEVLAAGGDVTRTRGPARGRGRPPWLYGAPNREQAVVDELLATLDGQLREGDAEDEVFIVEAAERWAEAMGPDFSPQDVSSPDEAVHAAAEALTKVGFSAEVSPLGDTIALRTCPYATLVADHPVICNIHTALLSDLLHRTGQPVEVSQMSVWATPTACLARLERPDLVPDRVITPGSSSSPTTGDQRPSTRPRPKKRKKKST